MSTNRVYDYNRPANPLSPGAIASARADALVDATEADRVHFISAYNKAREAAVMDDYRTYQWYRAALDADDSVAVAGIIEGIASTRTEGRVF